MSNSLKELVLDLFINNTNYQVEDICYSKQIHAGYTNTSFLFQTTDNNKFQIRIGNTNNSERKNELNALEIYDSKPIFFDVSNGNLVKK
jgi:hypothetical protein